MVHKGHAEGTREEEEIEDYRTVQTAQKKMLEDKMRRKVT
jgi:hypothetical protein